MAVAFLLSFTIYCAATSQEFPTTTNTPRPRLLIVDDSPVALAFLEAVFRGAHYEVETASNGVEGLDKALRNVPDLIVTDGLMPDVDGFELVRRLRSHPETLGVPVVMLTSVDTLDPEYSSRTPQPDALVAKSMQIEPLMEKVRALLAKSGGG
jgi:two-component system OmpR family response regulator